MDFSEILQDSSRNGGISLGKLNEIIDGIRRIAEEPNVLMVAPKMKRTVQYLSEGKLLPQRHKRKRPMRQGARHRIALTGEVIDRLLFEYVR